MSCFSVLYALIDLSQKMLFRLFERALTAAGTSFKSDKLWDMYLLWEKDNSNLRNVTKIYDRLISIPTQLYSHHFEQLSYRYDTHNHLSCIFVVFKAITFLLELLQ